MRITLQNPKKGHDYGESIEIEPVEYGIEPDPNHSTHMFETVTDTKGIKYRRSHNYASISPYGWERTN